MLLLRTLGQLRLESGDNTPLSSRRKELLLLAYLARRTSRTASRAELAGLLWHDRGDTRSRQSLRQAVLELKRVMGEGMMFEADQLVLAENVLELDATAFEGDLASGRLSEAVGRWRGDFLAGTEDLGGEQFRTWLEAEREGLRHRLHSALRRLIDDARQRGSWSEATVWAERWVETLPFDPDGFFQLVELLHLAGRTDEALARHAVFLTRLRTDLELEPTAEFVRLGARLERSAAALPSTAAPGSSALFTPDLVQRGPALAELLAAWRRVRSGGVAVVLVEGEAGIGKTRLCDAFVRDVEDDPKVLVLRVLGQGSDQSVELAAARALVTGLSRSPGLGGTSASALSELAHISPAIRNRFLSLPEPAGGEAQQVDALREALLVVVEECPIVVYIDDFHLVDTQSQGLIARLISRVDSGVLFLLTARSGDEAWSPMLSRVILHRGLERLKLQTLDPNGVEALLGSMLQLPPSDRHLLAHRLHEHGGGNPFYTIELTSALVDEGLLLPTETGSWRLAALDGHSLPLPTTVKEVIGRRLARLGYEVRITAEGAAVLGRTFDPQLVPTVAGLTPATCALAMEELIARKMVREVPLSPGMCEFTHDLICRVVYELLPAPLREKLHRSAARAWEGKARRNPAALTALAYHRTRAGLPAHVPRWRAHAAAAVVAVVGLAIVGGILWNRRPETSPARTHGDAADARQVLVVAPEIGSDSPAADSTAARLFHAALERALATRTPPAALVHETLARMRRLDTLAVPDRVTAREVAARAGVRLLLVPSLIRGGDRLTAAYRIEQTATGETIRAREEEGVGTAHVTSLAAGLVGTVARDVSAAAGAVPRLEALPEVTTASLDALYAYASGVRLSYTGDDAGSAMLRRAIALDSAFPAAQAKLAYFLWFDYDQRTAERHAAAAMRALAGLPPAERLRTMLDAAHASEDWPTAIDCARSLIELDPAAPNAWHTFAQLLYFNRQFIAAVDAYDSARVRTPGTLPVTLLINRATVVLRVGRIQEAVEGYEAAFAADPAVLRHPYVNHEYGAALVRLGRVADARAAYGVRLGGTPAERAAALRSLALLDAHAGRFTRARELLGSAVTGSTAVSDTLGAAIALLLRAEVAMTQGDSAPALVDIAILERYAKAKPLPYEVVTHAVKLLARARAMPRASALVERLGSQTTAISAPARARLLIARGEVLVARGRIREGRAAVEQALALDPTTEAKESAAFAAAAGNDLVEAGVRYDSLAADRGIDWDGHVVIELGKYYAGRAWDRAGHADRARTRYEAFLADWSAEASDSSLPAVVDARRRLAVPGG